MAMTSKEHYDRYKELHLKAKKNFDQKLKKLHIAFNIVDIEEDITIYEYLQTKENKTQYIKDLIKQDMNK